MMMKFEEQYPGVEKYIGHNSRIRRARKELAQKQEELKERSNQNFKEAVQMVILAPIVMAGMYVVYVTAWFFAG